MQLYIPVFTVLTLAAQLGWIMKSHVSPWLRDQLSPGRGGLSFLLYQPDSVGSTDASSSSSLAYTHNHRIVESTPGRSHFKEFLQIGSL